MFIEDKDSMRKILEGLGLGVFREYEKYRESYRFKDLLFEIEIYPEIPPLIEIEAPDLERMEEGVRMLGYTMDDAKPYNGWQLLEMYKVEGLRFTEEQLNFIEKLR